MFRAAYRLHAALADKTLVRSDFRIPSLATKDLSGGRIDRVRAAGKHLFVDLTGDGGRALSIHSHLMMDGAWHVYRPGQKWRRPGHRARVVLRTADTEAVGFDLGVLQLTADPAGVVAHLGPDLLGAQWDPAVAAANLAAAPECPLGPALLDQRLLAGIGNIYSNELCFIAGVHPATPVSAAGDLDRLVDIAHRLLTQNALRTVRVTTGDRRRGRELWVYGREHRPCRRCSTIVRRSAITIPPVTTDRVIFYCPSCQPARTVSPSF